MSMRQTSRLQFNVMARVVGFRFAFDDYVTRLASWNSFEFDTLPHSDTSLVKQFTESMEINNILK